MKLYRLPLHLALLATCLFVAAGPALAIAAFLAILWTFFCFAVIIMAAVLMGERWHDEGLKDYGIREALDDALHELVKGLRLVFHRDTWKSLKDDFAVIGRLYWGRLKLVSCFALVLAVSPLGVVIDGTKITYRGLRDIWQDLKYSWRYAR